MNPGDATLLGLAVTAIGLVLAFLTWRVTHKRDESRLAILSKFEAESYGGIALIVTLRNRGRHPIYVESIDLCLKSGQKLPYKDYQGFGLAQPIMVTEEKPEERLFALSSYMKQIKTPLAIKGIEVRDTLGKAYKFPTGWFWSHHGFSDQIKQQWTVERQEYWKSRLEGS
jgi:hypothetical protein